MFGNHSVNSNHNNLNMDQINFLTSRDGNLGRENCVVNFFLSWVRFGSNFVAYYGDFEQKRFFTFILRLCLIEILNVNCLRLFDYLQKLPKTVFWLYILANLGPA